MSFSVADELIKLKSLLDSGVLTKEEFDIQKNRILSNETTDTNLAVCNILGKECDISFIHNLLEQGKYFQIISAVDKIADGYFAKHDTRPLVFLLSYIDEKDSLPDVIVEQDLVYPKLKNNSDFLDLAKRWKEWEENPKTKISHKTGQLFCPKCGSSAITTGQRGWKLSTGFLGSSKTVNRCGSCGHTWTP